MNINDNQRRYLADIMFFQITVIADLVVDGITYKNIRQSTNESIITTENWEAHKDTFLIQRMGIYPDSYTIEQKINRELEKIEILPLRNDDFKVLADNYRNHLRSHNTVPNKIKKRTSYVWQNNPDNELPELHRLMINKYKLIAPETTYEQFKDIFTGQPIDESFEPIRWLNSNRLLAYFLDSVFSSQDWQSIAGNGKLFKNSNNKVITANDLSVAKKGYVDCGLPRNYEKIDVILKDIKKH